MGRTMTANEAEEAAWEAVEAWMERERTDHVSPELAERIALAAGVPAHGAARLRAEMAL